jgi:hypothetical protein
MDDHSFELQGRLYDWDDLNFIIWDIFNGLNEQEQIAFLARYERKSLDRLIAEAEANPDGL